MLGQSLDDLISAELKKSIPGFQKLSRIR